MSQPSRNVLITGANRGLGLETARQLLQRGYRVILTSRDPRSGEQVSRQLNAGDKLVYHPLDVTLMESIHALQEFVSSRMGYLDALINNAGIYLEGSRGLLEISEGELRQTLETNLLGPVWLCRAFLPGMAAQDYGRIVNVSSGMGQMDDLDNYGAAYRLSKLGLNGVTRILQDSVGKANILVNAVCPGWVRTDMGGSGASRSIEQGASGIVWAATLPNSGPRGGFFRDGKPIPW